jgi:TP901 family phage tail tape measure protein
MSDVNANIGININAASALAELKALQRQIATFHQQVAKGSASAAIAQKGLQTNLLNAINATGKFHAQMGLVRTSTESFTHALETNKMSMGQYFKYAAGSTKTFGKLFKSEFDTIGKVAQERVKKMQTQYIKMGKDAQGATKAMSITPHSLNMKDAATQTAIASQKQAIFNQLVRQGSTNLLNFGKNTQWAGRQLMVGFSVPLLYIGTVAGKVFMDLEQQALKFKRVYGDMFTTSDQTNKALKDVELLAKEFTKYGVAVSKTMEMAASAAAMGKTGADLTAQVAQATRLAVLGNVEQEQALETTTSLTNAFGLAAEDLAGKIDFLNSVENQTVTSIEDLTIAIPKAGPVIKQLGGNVEDLAFFLTAMKEGGINASEGANALKSGLASLINPSKKAAGMLADLGINIKGIVESNKGDIKSTVIGFAQALDTLAPLDRSRAIEQLFGKFQFARLSTLFQNITKEGTQANKVLELSKMEVEELAILSERELKTVENAVGTNFKEAVETLKLTIAPIGKTFLEAVTPIIKVLANVLDKFNNLGDGTKKFIVIATGLVGFIGPVLLMTFGLLANGLANIIKLFLALRVGFLKMTKDSSSLGASTNYLTAEQLEATTVAASLNQAHTRLTQQFQLETGAVSALRSAYVAATVAATKFAMANPGMMAPGRGGKPKKFARGSTYVPGTGNKDTVASMLTPGEAVIPAPIAQDPLFQPIIDAMVNGKLQGFNEGTGKVTQASKNKTKMSPKDDFTHVGRSESVSTQQYLRDTAGLSDYDRARVEFSEGIQKTQGKSPTMGSYGGLGFAFDKILNINLAKSGGISLASFEQEWLKKGPEKWNADGRDLIDNLHGKDNKVIDDGMLAKVREEAAKNNGRVTDDIIKKSFQDLPESVKTTPTYQSMDKRLRGNAEYGLTGISNDPKKVVAILEEAVKKGNIAPAKVVVIDGDALEYNGKPVPAGKKLSQVLGDPGFEYPTGVHSVVTRTNSQGKIVAGSTNGYDPRFPNEVINLSHGSKRVRGNLGKRQDLKALPSQDAKVIKKRLNKKSLEEMKRIDAEVRSSSMAKVKPTDFGKQLAPSTGYSFPVAGVGGLYEKPDGTRVFVKPMVDEKSAMAELRANKIAREAHGLETPEQVMKVMADPNNKRRKLIVLESAFNPKFAESSMTGKFTQDQYFRQLVASALRGDKDLKRGNLSGNILTDPGAAGVFDRASGRRDFSAGMPSMLGQAEINLLGAPGGRGLSKDFALSTLDIPKQMSADEYHRRMIAEIDTVLPKLKKSIASMDIIDPIEKAAYKDMIARLEQGKLTDWRGVHKMHFAVKPAMVTKKESLLDEKTGKIEKVKGKKKPEGVKPSTGKLADSKFTVIPEGKKVVQTPARRAGRYFVPGFKNAPVPTNLANPFTTQSEIAANTRVTAEAIKATENLTKATDETTKASRLSKESLKSFGAKANLGVGALSALTVGASFAGGKIGEMATKIMPFVFGLQGILLLLPMLMNPLIGLPLAIGAVVAGIWLFNKKQSDAIKAEARLVDELYATTKKMQQVGEIFGKVGASQLAARKRESGGGDFSFERKGIKAGSAFLQSEPGKADLAAFETRFKAMPDIAMREFALKLGSYVSDGVIDAAQAASIADQIGIEFKDKVLGIKIQGQLQQLLTVDGKDLTKEPFEIRIKIAEETVNQFNNLVPNLQDQLAKAEQQKNALGDKLTLAKTDVAAYAITKEEFDAIEKEFRDAEKRVASIKNSIKQNSAFASGMASQAYEAIQAQIDGIDVSTSKSIDKLKAEKAATKDLEKQALIQKEIDTLESKRTASLSKLKAMNDKVTKGIEEQLKLSSGTEKTTFFTGSAEAVRSKFKGTKQESDAELLLAKTGQMGQSVVRAKIEAVVSSGQFGPGQASGFINLFGDDKEALNTTLNAYLNVQGIEDLNKLQSIVGTFEDQELAKKIIVDLSAPGLSDAEFQAQYSTLELLMQMDSEEINIELVLKDPDALARITKINTAIENIPNVTQKSVELALTQQGFPSGGIDEISQNWEYFAGLPTDLRKTALQTFTTLHATIFANKESKMEWARNYAETMTPNLRKQNREEAVTRVLTTIIDVKTGEFTTKGNKAIAADVLAQTKDIIGLQNMINNLMGAKGGGGGTGTRNTFLDNILDKIRRVRDASANIVSDDPLKELRRLIAKGNGEITIFDGLDQQISNLKAPQEFIDFIASLDPKGKKGAIDSLATYLDTEKLKKGIVELTKDGKLLLGIFEEGVIGDFESDLKKSTNALIVQKAEFIRLNLTVKDNKLSAEMLADANFALALSSAKTEEEVNRLVAVFKAQKAAQDDLAKTQDPLAYLQNQFSGVEDKVNKFFSLARQGIEGLDPDGDGPGESFARRIFNGEKAVQEAQDAVSVIEKEIDGIQTGINAKEVRIQKEVTIPLRKFEEAITEIQEKISTKFDEPIGVFQEEASDLSNDLTLIDKAAGAINEKYDAQEEALNKISEINQDLITQEKQRISLADALSQGDISAAAQIAQDMRSTAAQKAASGTENLLNVAREQEIANLRSASGQTRLEIEQRQFAITQEIYKLEESREILEAKIAKIKKNDILPLENLRKQISIDIRNEEDKIYAITNGRLLTAQNELRTKQDNLIAIENEKQAELLKLAELELKWTEVQAGIAAAEANTIDLQGAITEAIRLARELSTIFASMGNFSGSNLNASGTTTFVPDPNASSEANAEGQDAANAASDAADAAAEAIDAAVAAALAAADAVADITAEADALAAKIAEDLAASNASLSPKGKKILADAAKAEEERLAALAKQNAQYAARAEGMAKRYGNLTLSSGGMVPKYMAAGGMAAPLMRSERMPIQMSYGGMVPKYFAVGGMSRGTDTVPAMLTPGEFVMSKYAVDSYGVDKMKAINRGSYEGEKVYNYNLNVNVKSDANPQDIARVVMTQIRQVDSQRIRTQRD